MPPMVDPPLVIAHAGGAALGPENTMAAINASLAAGVEAIEIDVRRSSDGVPILIHDRSVARTTGGEGNVDEMTVEQLQTLDAGNGEKIPKLSDVIDVVKGKARLNIEIKQEDIEGEIVEVVRAANAADEVWVSSFSPDVIEACKWIAPEIERSLLFSGFKEDASLFILYNTSNLLLRSLSPSIEFVEKRPEFVELCHRRGVRCLAWTVDGEERLAAARTLEVDAVFTNEPNVALMLYRPQVVALV
jgi:glycerophosphoryl diester phosphodiesterase